MYSALGVGSERVAGVRRSPELRCFQRLVSAESQYKFYSALLASECKMKDDFGTHR